MKSKIKVIVVDDYHDTADSLTDLLNAWGYDAKPAYDGFDALDVIKEMIPDIIILDIGLPGMNGYQVAQEIRKDVRLNGTTIVGVTGYARLSDRNRALDAGFDHIFAKPANPAEFKRLMDQISTTLQ